MKTTSIAVAEGGDLGRQEIAAHRAAAVSARGYKNAYA
jgi:hypothetical protein